MNRVDRAAVLCVAKDKAFDLCHHRRRASPSPAWRPSPFHHLPIPLRHKQPGASFVGGLFQHASLLALPVSGTKHIKAGPRANVLGAIKRVTHQLLAGWSSSKSNRAHQYGLPWQSLRPLAQPPSPLQCLARAFRPTCRCIASRAAPLSPRTPPARAPAGTRVQTECSETEETTRETRRAITKAWVSC